MKRILLALLILCFVAAYYPMACVAVKVSDFNVELISYGTHYNYRPSDRVLDIDRPGRYAIFNTDPKKPTQDRIEITACEGRVELSLIGINIDVSSKKDCAALKISDRCNAEVVITIVDNNFLRSGENCAGLQKDGKGKLTINSDDISNTLTAQGGYCAAGIGGGNRQSVNNIHIIGGHIIARGGVAKKLENGVTWAPECTAGAGIGGGNFGNATNIFIVGNAKVDTTGGHWAAGIGAGREGDAGEICIGENSIVKSTGGYRGSGIGTGKQGKVTGTIRIIHNAKVTATGKGRNSSGIGSGDNASTSGRCTIEDRAELVSTGAIGEKNERGVMVGGGYGICCLELIISGESSIASQGYLSGSAFSVVPIFRNYTNLQVSALENSTGAIIDKPDRKMYTESKYISIGPGAHTVDQSPQPRKPVTSKKAELPKPSKPASAPTAYEPQYYALEIVERINEIRTAAGLDTVTIDSKVQAAAETRAIELETLYSNTRPNGSPGFTALKENGANYTCAIESFARGAHTPEEAMSIWLRSDKYLSNICKPEIKNIGIGFFVGSDGGYYWTQILTCPIADINFDKYRSEIVRLVNEERAKNGLSRVRMDKKVQAAAQIRAIEQEISFSHTRPNGSSCFTTLNENDIIYRGAGENLAMGQNTPEAVMNSWMRSPGHRENILNPEFKYLGVGVYQDSNGKIYWTQMFTY